MVLAKILRYQVLLANCVELLLLIIFFLCRLIRLVLTLLLELLLLIIFFLCRLIRLVLTLPVSTATTVDRACLELVKTRLGRWVPKRLLNNLH